jgi:molybdenum cofactor biosynthesis enzyme MoaA
MSAVESFYCSQKFTSLSIDLEKRLLYSCCAAAPEKIDTNWLKQNPGQLFGNPILQQDRQHMLENIRVASCESTCWRPESQGLQSRRLQYKSYQPTHNDITVRQPEKLNIILGSTCNLTCSYCCKQYSTAWAKEIQQNGPYFEHPRFSLLPLDMVLAKISHKEHRTTAIYQDLFDEIASYNNLDEIEITGGEPFLYNDFIDLINSINTTKNLIFYTGLGVNTKRLKSQLSKIKQHDNITAYVSAENCNEFYEFNRFGNTYQDFLERLKILQDHVNVKFGSTISNVTIHDLDNFVKTFGDQNIRYNFCNDPDWLQINVLDQHTKERLAKNISNSNIRLKDDIVASMMKPCSEQQRTQFATYLYEFGRRRNLNLDIFPGNMLQWLNLI